MGRVTRSMIDFQTAPGVVFPPGWQYFMYIWKNKDFTGPSVSQVTMSSRNANLATPTFTYT